MILREQDEAFKDMRKDEEELGGEERLFRLDQR